MVMLTGEQIRALRKFLCLTAEKFGQRVQGVTWNTVFRWESGDRFPSRQKQLVLNELLRQALIDGFELPAAPPSPAETMTDSSSVTKS